MPSLASTSAGATRVSQSMRENRGPLLGSATGWPAALFGSRVAIQAEEPLETTSTTTRVVARVKRHQRDSLIDWRDLTGASGRCNRRSELRGERDLPTDTCGAAYPSRLIERSCRFRPLPKLQWPCQ